jgi:hypothetical protein
LVASEKITNERTPDDCKPDPEMQAIGYPPPADQASFARRLSEIIQRALGRRKST